MTTMTTMTKGDARKKLIEALVEDQLASYQGDSSGWDQVRSLLSEGFKGFEKMSDAELVQCAYDSGVVDEYEDEVDVLEA